MTATVERFVRNARWTFQGWRDAEREAVLYKREYHTRFETAGRGDEGVPAAHLFELREQIRPLDYESDDWLANSMRQPYGKDRWGRYEYF
jgi:hypothetical protein